MLPIPPGLHWSEAMPVMVAEPIEKAPRAKRAKTVAAEPIKVKKQAMQFGPPGANDEPEAAPVTTAIVPAVEKTLSAPVRVRTKVDPSAASKIDPKLIAAARELRDRYLEQVNAESMPAIGGKYDVSKANDAKPQRTRLAA